MPLRRSARERRLLREELFALQKGRCHWCEGPMSIARGHSDHRHYGTFEHLTPKANGGQGHRENLVLAHRRCNEARGRAMVLGRPWPPAPTQETPDATAG